MSSVQTHCVHRTSKGERCKRVVKNNKYILDGSIVRYYCHAHEKYAVGLKVESNFDTSEFYNHGSIDDPMDLDVVEREDIVTKKRKRPEDDLKTVIDEYEEVVVMVKVKRTKIVQ